MDKEAYETLAKIKQGNDPGTDLILIPSQLRMAAAETMML
jgi:hypothetical protein